MTSSRSEEDPSVTLFREYLRIKTVHPTPDYANAEKFLKRVGEELLRGEESEIRSVEMVPGKPIVLFTWFGTDRSLPSVLLNSHIDVVPVEENKWSYPPFDAYKDEATGNIYARGTQDMKCVGIQHIEAVRRMKAKGLKPLRTIHISFVPDEEIGGADGMGKFINSQEFKDLNVGFALDEGLSSLNEEAIVFYGERVAWWIQVDAFGPTGHGSQLFSQTAVDSLMKFLSNLTSWRDEQSKKLRSDLKLRLGDVTSINISMIKGGCFTPDGSNYQINVIPSEATAGIDMRIAPDVNLPELKQRIEGWIEEHNNNNRTVLSYKLRSSMDLRHHITSLNEDENPWWKSFSSTLKQLNYPYETQIFPAATDSRYIRSKGVPALGFSPINKTPVLLHDHNEYLNEATFLKGIDVMEALVSNLANLSRHRLDPQ